MTFLQLDGNQLTGLIVPTDIRRLNGLFVDGNPLTTLVLSEPLAAASLAGTVASLRDQGVSVFTYPLALSLLSPRRTLPGPFQFTLTGPPGLYHVLSSTNLTAWTELAAVTNQLGSVVFTDATADLPSEKFYQVHSP